MNTITLKVDCFPIESAPKDRFILLWDTSQGIWQKGHYGYEAGYMEWTWLTHDGYDVIPASHWTELGSFDLS